MKSILEAEKASKLFVDTSTGYDQIDMGPIANTWFVKFIQVLGRGLPKENVKNLFENVSFIVFNYDRCIEHFFLHAIQAVYGLRRDDAYEVLKTLDIVHPYGTLSDLPFGGQK